jgi:hypothetical protein
MDEQAFLTTTSGGGTLLVPSPAGRGPGSGERLDGRSSVSSASGRAGPVGPGPDSVESSEVGAVVVDPEVFYRELLAALGEHARRGGTAYGAAVVAKRVALAHGLEVGRLPLPRPTRLERDELGIGGGLRGWRR